MKIPAGNPLQAGQTRSGFMASGNFAYAAGSDLLRVGLVGCGGRGTGAARDAAQAAEGVEIVAMADMFKDRLDASRKNLAESIGNSFRVTDEASFIGFDGYKHVIDSGIDIVLLAEPPGFRPFTFRYAVEAEKHVFMEKPISVDPTGARSVIETGELARQKGLSVAAGTMFRRQPSYYEVVSRIHDGFIGEIVAAQFYYLTGPIWLRQRRPGMTDIEWQCLNWYYFTWLSGDHIVEQFVHNMDVMKWVFGGPPVSCVGTGGRISRVSPSFGHIYDHFDIEFEFENGLRATASCRQFENSYERIEDRIVGTEGIATMRHTSSFVVSREGESMLRHPDRGNNPYLQTHVDLVASIRNGDPLSEARSVAESTLIAIMGREAAYTGQEITWDQVVNSSQSLVPDSFEYGPVPHQSVAVPGRTQLDRTEWVQAAR